MSNSLSFRCHFGTEFFFHLSSQFIHRGKLVFPMTMTIIIIFLLDYITKKNNQKYETIQIKWHLFSFVFFFAQPRIIVFRLRIRLFAFKCNNNKNLYMNNGQNSIKIKEINFFSKFTSLNEWYLRFLILNSRKKKQ